MSDFPSIKDLSQGKASAQGAASPPAPAAGTTAAKFSDKMKEINRREKEAIAEAEAAKLGLPYIDLAAFPVSAEALKAISEAEARETGTVCFYFTSEEMRLGTCRPGPAAEELAYQLGERHHASVILHLISESSLERVLSLYANLPVVKPVTKDIVITDEELARYEVGINNLASLSAAFQNVTISDILTLMIASALKVNATDIHVEAEETDIVIRYRIDGVLHEVARLPKEEWKRFVARIKLLSALKLNITDRPQDGRVTLVLSSDSLDVRVSTMPTIHGESVVMRILQSGRSGVTFDELGLSGKAHDRLRQEILRPNGMVITTGPTGSGKTTTMYAILKTLNKPGVKIITLEDPIEIKMDGINQSQVDAAHDYTFVKGLRSLLRQDPDICMVGEIRDLETAEIAIQAALTGHLMLSTIHTNSAAGVIPRFLSMGVKPFLLAPALNAVIGQRLVRRICEACRTEADLAPEILKRAREILQALPESEKEKVDLRALRFYRGAGCDRCSGLGYQGRIGLYEVFSLDKEIEQIILSGKVSEYAIQDVAVRNGMVTMVQDGLMKALAGITTVDEVFRVAE